MKFARTASLSNLEPDPQGLKLRFLDALADDNLSTPHPLPLSRKRRGVPRVCSCPTGGRADLLLLPLP
jgi:hypothetical protein